MGFRYNPSVIVDEEKLAPGIRVRLRAPELTDGNYEGYLYDIEAMPYVTIVDVKKPDPEEKQSVVVCGKTIPMKYSRYVVEVPNDETGVRFRKKYKKDGATLPVFWISEILGDEFEAASADELIDMLFVRGANSRCKTI